jgi:hypothetical protein
MSINPNKTQTTTAGGPGDDPTVAAKKSHIRLLWKENESLQARNKENRYELGKSLDELHDLRAHHGNGTYDKDVESLGIPKPTAWRIRNYYRELAGLAPVSQSVSVEANSPGGSDADTPGAAGSSAVGETSGPGMTETPKAGADRLRADSKQKKKVTQVRLEPARHDVFRKALKECAAELGTDSDSETIFKLVTNYKVQPCAK